MTKTYTELADAVVAAINSARQGAVWRKISDADLRDILQALREGEEGCSSSRDLSPAVQCQAETDNWRPIETAPRDGTEILLCSEPAGTDTMIGRWISLSDFLTDREAEELAREGMAEDELDRPDWFYADFICGGRLEADCAPTHWMPLPAPPSSAMSAASESSRDELNPSANEGAGS